MSTTTPDNRPYMISYAQNFEDVILERIFKGVEAGFYVDIGACHPVYDSVTQHFYQKGWSGVNVEPQPELFAELQLHRDRDTNLNFCVGNSEGQQTLHITSDQGTSTLVQSLAEKYIKAGKVSQTINVAVIPLKELWEKYVSGREVDFLKIDVEGYETAVLEGADFTIVTPKILVIEAVDPITHASSHHEWEHHLNSHYEFCYFDGLNRFYRRKDLNLPASCFSSPPNVFDQFKTYREQLAEEAQKYLQTEIESHLTRIEHVEAMLEQKDEALANASAAYQHQKNAAQDATRDYHALQAETESHLARIQYLEVMLEQKDKALADASAAYQTLRSQFDEKLAELQGFAQPGNQTSTPMSTQSTHDTCIFTIVSNNYLHYANTLFESLAEHCPEADLVLGLCDRQTEDTHCPEAIDIIPIDQLDIPQIGTFIYQYSILELNTAIKPYVIEMLMNRGYRKVIYFDPDIKIFRPLDEMLALLDQHSVLLTPHLTDLLDDGKNPSERHILQAGSYNLGYIGLSTCEETRKLVKWWQDKLYKECVVDLPRGLFVDQKWMDLVPSMFSGVHIHRDPSWNIAYWNLNHRDLQQPEPDCFTVDGRPLTFFHFSGYSIDATTLSKHQNRFNKGHNGSPLRELCSHYDQALLRNGIENFKKLPYAFSNFADGTPVPDAARRLIRSNVTLENIDFFDVQQCPRIHAELNRPSSTDSGGVPLTALALALWQSRPDLQNAFPAVESIDSIRFAEWLLEAAPHEAGFSDLYCQPIRQALSQAHQKIDAQPTSQAKRLSHKLFHFAWQHRRRVPKGVRIALAPYAGWLLHKAYPRQLSATLAAESPKPLPNSDEPGINLIGYLHAESGVGEAARASLRALRQSEIQFSLIDYRLGNISRMGEDIGGHENKAWYQINLMQVNADQSKIARDHLGSDLFEGRYTIGYWYWEMPEFPDFLHFAYDQVDEIWVSTEYNRKAISKHTEKPVVVIPPSIEVKIDRPLSRTDLHLPEDTFVFLHISDVLSIPERKNPMGVVDAFLMAFGDQPDVNVKLVLKLSNLDHQPALSEKIFGIIENEPRIQLIHEYLDRNTLNNLINACDCYVSLHRAEGFGLPIAEAMYLGKPVIATHWSGNVDFMTEQNSLPVSYELVTLQEDFGPYKKGQHWAEPDIKDAAQKMCDLVSGNTQIPLDTLQKHAVQAMLEHYGTAHTASIINARIKEVKNLDLHRTLATA